MREARRQWVQAALDNGKVKGETNVFIAEWHR